VLPLSGHILRAPFKGSRDDIGASEMALTSRLMVAARVLTILPLARAQATTPHMFPDHVQLVPIPLGAAELLPPRLVPMESPVRSAPPSLPSPEPVKPPAQREAVATPESIALEKLLVERMRWIPEKDRRDQDEERAGSLEIIDRCTKVGLIRYDVSFLGDTDKWWIVEHPATFLGHDLLVIEVGDIFSDGRDGDDPRMPDEGITVDVRLTHDDAYLVKFSKENKCDYKQLHDLMELWTFVQREWAKEKPKRHHPKVAFAPGTYAEIGCTRSAKESVDEAKAEDRETNPDHWIKAK
jgi:hypothetical protein